MSESVCIWREVDGDDGIFVVTSCNCSTYDYSADEHNVSNVNGKPCRYCGKIVRVGELPDSYWEYYRSDKK